MLVPEALGPLVAVWAAGCGLNSAYKVEATDDPSSITDPMNAVAFLFQRLWYILGSNVLDIVTISRLFPAA